MIIKIHNQEVLIDDEDYERVSAIEWKPSFNGYFISHYTVHGCQRCRHLHRFIIGNTSKQDTDHINQNKLDNRKANLRVCSRRENSFNRPKPYAASSKYKGVYWSKTANKWAANINYKYKTIGLLYSSIEDECGYAYNHAAKLLAKEFAFANPIGYVSPEIMADIEAAVQFKLRLYVNR